MRAIVAFAVCAVMSACSYQVCVSSEPFGSAVYVDGIERGLTPCAVEAKKSSAIVVKHAGYRDAFVVIHDKPVDPLAFLLLGPLAEEVEHNYMVKLWPLEEEKKPEVY